MHQTSGAFGREVDIPLPDDFHIHLRQGLPLTTYTRDAALAFGRVLVMPNTNPPIRIPREVQKYRERIVTAARGARGFRENVSGATSTEPAARGARGGTENASGATSTEPAESGTQVFQPLMTFYIDSEQRREEIQALADAGVVAGKLYPKHATTNSAFGVARVEDAYSAFEAMEELGLVLCIHGEVPGAFVLDREQAFLPSLERIAARFPRLRIVLEHVTSAAGVTAVRALPENVAATITVHHLMFTLDDVVGEAIRPHNFCKPIAKRPDDLEVIREAAFSGDRKFFFGSDSAPHTVDAKECDAGCAGVYSAPTAVPLLLELFERYSDLDSFVAFTARNGAGFYELPYTDVIARYSRRPWTVSGRYNDVVPLAAGSTLEWRENGRRKVDGPAQAEVHK
ncbi:MAG: amidohydrolase family protein [bacterium]